MKNKVMFNGDRVSPSKVVCVGRNYVGHIKELNNDAPDKPVIFIKPNSAVSEEVNLKGAEVIHYEAELAFVIGAGELVGVGLGLDLTKRSVQSELKSQGLPWERAKAFDGSAVFSDFVLIPGSVLDLSLELYINGQLKQKGGCLTMINKPNDLLKEITSFLTFEDYDVVMTGTPSGVGQLQKGNQLLGRVFSQGRSLVEIKWSVN